MGRPRDTVWEGFDRIHKSGNTGIRAKCKNCGHELQGLVDRLKQHTTKCTGVYVENPLSEKEDDKTNEEKKPSSSITSSHIMDNAGESENDKDVSINVDCRAEAGLKAEVAEDVSVNRENGTLPSDTESPSMEYTLEGPRAGRKRDAIWKEFTRVEIPGMCGSMSVEWYCKNCENQVSPYSNRLRDHYERCVVQGGSENIRRTPGRQKTSIWSKFDKVLLDGDESKTKWFCRICDHRVSAYAPRLRAHYIKCLAEQTKKNPVLNIQEEMSVEKDEKHEGCLFCGKHFETDSLCQEQEGLFAAWRIDSVDSVSRILQFDQSKTEMLKKKPCCPKCAELTREIDFLLRTIRTFQSQLSLAQTKLLNIWNANKNNKCQREVQSESVIPASLVSAEIFIKEELEEERHYPLLQVSQPLSPASLQRKRKLVQERREKLESERNKSTKESNQTGSAQINQQRSEHINSVHSTRRTTFPKTGTRKFEFDVTEKVDDMDEEEELESEAGDSHFESYESDERYQATPTPPEAHSRNNTSDEEWTETVIVKKKMEKRNLNRRTWRRVKSLKKTTVIGIPENSGRIKCHFDACVFRCNKTETFEVHVRSVHEGDPTPHHCTLCEKKFRNYDSLHYHRKCHEKGRAEEEFLICPVSHCSQRFRFNHENAFRRHIKWRHYGADRGCCQFCSLTFSKGEDGTKELGQHEINHRESNIPFSCVVVNCGVAFTNFLDLKKHVAHTHEETTLICEKCPGKIFRSPASLKSHQFRVHGGQKGKRELKCDECTFVARCKSVFLIHKNSHRTERPHMCDECGATYKTQGTLKRHLFTHTGETPYKCKYCSKSFNMPQKLRDHEETHAPNLTYLCSGCGKAFRCRKNLGQHSRFHCPVKNSLRGIQRKAPPRKRKAKARLEKFEKNRKNEKGLEEDEERSPGVHPGPSKSQSLQSTGVQLPTTWQESQQRTFAPNYHPLGFLTAAGRREGYAGHFLDTVQQWSSQGGVGGPH